MPTTAAHSRQEQVDLLRKEAMRTGSEVYQVGKDEIPAVVRLWMTNHPPDPKLEDTLVVRLPDGEIRYGGWKGEQIYVGMEHEIAEKAKAEVAASASESRSLLDWDTVRPEIEKIYRVQLTDDDPLRMVADVVRIVLLQSQAGAARVLKNQLAENLAEFNQSLDIAMKSRQQEGHSNIQKMLTVAQCQLKLAGSEIESQLRSETSELVSAAKDLRSVNRSMRWFDRLMGAAFMAFVLAIGIVVGAGLAIAFLR